MLSERNNYWKCNLETCEQLFILINCYAADIYPINSTCYACNSLSGSHVDNVNIFSRLKDNKDDIALLAKERVLLDRLIFDELRKKSRNKIRMTKEQICTLKQYCDVRSMAERELNILFTVLQLDIQRLMDRFRRLLDDSCLFEFIMQIGSYIHEQEFIKAYLRVVNDCSRKTWSAIYC